MKLLEHLVDNFPVDWHWPDEALVQNMLEEFGVNAKSEPGPAGTYWIFKYGMIIAKWGPIARECRGCILHFSERSGWEILSRPFDKFFNQHEGHSGVHEARDFEARIGDFFFVEKADGTCIQVWWDPYNDKWRASTLGMITTTTISRYSEETFGSLFWKTVNVSWDLHIVDKKRTYLFELCCPENRIVTQYSSSRIYSLGSREIISGAYSSSLFACWRIPKVYRLSFADIFTLQQARDWVDAHTGETEERGKYPEGFVVYDRDGPVCKMKSSAYLALHHATGAGNLACGLNRAIEALWKGSLDDILDALDPIVVKQLELVRAWYREIALRVNVASLQLQAVTFATQKDYALAVQAAVPNKRFQGFFFQNKSEILSDDNVGDGTLFESWMRANGKKFIEDAKRVVFEAEQDTKNNPEIS